MLFRSLLGRDWIHPNFCIPSTLHQFLIFWNGEEVEVINADNKPFIARVNGAEAMLYEDHIGLVKLIGMNKHGGPESFMFFKDQALDAKAAYDDNDRISLVTLIVIDEEVLNGVTLSKYEGELAVKASLARVEAYLADRKAQLGIRESSVALTECTLEEEELYLDAIQLDELEPANKKLDDLMAEVQDPLREVNLGDEGENKPTYISQLLEPDF